MASRGELRSMVKSFRTSELESLLNTMDRGHSRNGRSKTDMLKRVLDLIDRGVSSSAELKIRDIYGKSSSSSSSHRGVSSHSRSHSSASLASGSSTKSLSSKSLLAVAPSRSSVDSSLQRRPAVGESAARRSGQGSTSRHEVSLKPLPFYDVLHEITKPSSLVPRSTARQQEMRFNFTLTQQQCDEIINSRDNNHPNFPQYTVQIQLRFCVADPSSRQSDCFPSGVSVKVNNLAASLPNLIPTNKPGAEPKRPGRPVDITPLCNLTPSVVNTIVVSWAVQESKQTHCASLYLVKKLTSECLLQRLMQNSTRRGDYTKTMIRDKMSLDKDNEIATTGIFVSLLCPIGKMRMKVPCRTATCDHLQCFDAITFLKMNEKKPTWMCPVCDRPADYSKLIIDGLLCEVINESTNSTEIEMSRDGKWRVTQVEEPDEDDDDDDYDDYPIPAASPAPEDAAEPSVETASEAVDLTESDDERYVPTASCDESTRDSVDNLSAAATLSQRAESPGSDAMSMSPQSSPEAVGELSDSLPPPPVEEILPMAIPLPPSAVPLPPIPLPPDSPPKSQSLPPPLPLPPEPVAPLPHQVGYPSYYPSTKIPISLLSNSNYGSAHSAVADPAALHRPLETVYGGGAPYEGRAAQNGSMVDFMSIMSGMPDYGAFTVMPNQFMPQPPPPPKGGTGDST